MSTNPSGVIQPELSELDWESELAPDASKSAYAYEIEELEEEKEDSEDEAQAHPPTRTDRQLAKDASELAAAFTRQTPSTTTAAAGGAILHLSPPKMAGGAGVQNQQTTIEDVDMMQGDENEDEEEMDDDEDEDDDDDMDELGPSSAADEQFQRELEMRNNQFAPGAKEEDLLSQILKGGPNKWKKTPRQREEEEENEGSAASATGKKGAELHLHPSSAAPSIADDTLDYQIYSDRLLECITPAAANQAIQGLGALRVAIFQYLSTYTADHIWQKEPLSLQVCSPGSHPSTERSAFSQKHSSSHSTVIPHLHGSTYFGDNLTDEWFILWLLLNLTSHYTDLSICVRDQDGEPLAIEVAEVLPSNITGPDEARNRIWIRRGMMHLIPIPSTPAELALIPMRPSVEQALAILANQPVLTASNSTIQTALLKKLEPFVTASSRIPFQFPSDSLSASHYAKVLLPLPCAILLQLYPQLVAEWINNFFYRDQLDMKRANKMERILGGKRTTKQPSASTSAEESVMSDESTSSSSTATVIPFVFTRVRFTHCLYAQLLQQRFGRPRVFTKPISAALANTSVSGPAIEKAIDLGIKLATGAEMWLWNQKGDLLKKVKRIEASRRNKSETSSNIQSVAVELVKAAKNETFNSSLEVESFLSSSTAAPAEFSPLIRDWRLFLEQIDSHKVSSLHSSTTSSYWYSLVIYFLYSQYLPHQCVDHEVDELRLDPLQQRLFDPSNQILPGGSHRVDSSINLPYIVRVIELMDALCDAACDSEPATSTAAIDLVPSNLPSTLLSHTFHSLGADDSEDWMMLTPMDLEKMMQQSTPSAPGSSSQSQMDSGGFGQFDGQAIVSSMNRFVNKISDIEGVEPPQIKTTSKPNQQTAPSTTKPKPSTTAVPTSILKKPSTDASAVTSKPELQVDDNELMRILAAVQANPLAYAFPTSSGGLKTGGFNQAVAGATRLSAQLPASDSEDEEMEELLPEDENTKRNNQGRSSNALPRGTVVVEEEDTDMSYPAPTKQNTRPPLQNAYAPIFDDDETTPSTSNLPYVSTVNVPPPASAIHTHHTSHPPVAATSSRVLHPSPSSSTHPVPIATSPAPATKKPKLHDYMDAMDDELRREGLQSSFIHDEEDAMDSTSSSQQRPVNVDVNLLSNLLQSHAAELDASTLGGSQMQVGPVTSIMSSMGLQMPTATRANESKEERKST